MKSIKLFVSILVIAALYVYFHNPILSNGIGSCKILYIFAILYVVFNVHRFSYYISLFKKEFVLLLILIVYSAFEYLRSGEPNTVRLHIVGLMEYFVLPFFLISYIKSISKEDSGSFIRYMLIIGCAGAIITTACVSSPSINEYVRMTFNKAVLASTDDYRANTMYRGFGISEALTYSYGIIQGMFFVITLFYLRQNRWALLIAFFIILSAALNARTGIVVAAAGLILYFTYSKKNSTFLVVVSLFIIALLNISSIFNLIGVGSQTIDWLSLFMNEADSIFTNASLTASDTTSYMFKDMLILPRDMSEWLIGCGYDVYWSTGRRSDLGWIIQLNFGGIPYLLLELTLLCYMYKRLKKRGFKNMAMFFAVAFIISNTKGPVLPNSGIFRFIMLFYIYYIMYSKEMREYGVASTISINRKKISPKMNL